jgi:hypothetical protein
VQVEEELVGVEEVRVNEVEGQKVGGEECEVEQLHSNEKCITFSLLLFWQFDIRLFFA